MDIHDLIAFSAFLEKVRAVERVIRIPGSKRLENDTEHSYMLAMLAWYMCSAGRLKLDLDKIIRYCLAHDIVEAYAGDTYFHETDTTIVESKVARENEALERIAREFPKSPDIIEAVRSYQEMRDEEARFVYALDKVQPVLVLYLEGGGWWKTKKVSLDVVRRMKDAKIAVSPQVEVYWEQLLEILEGRKGEFFWDGVSE